MQSFTQFMKEDVDNIVFDLVKINDVSFRVVAYDKSNPNPTYSNHEPYKFIERDGAIGFLDMEEKEEEGDFDFLVVDNVYLISTYRKRGIGYRMYNEALRVAKRNGYRGIASNPNERNELSDIVWKKISQGVDKGFDIMVRPIRGS